MRRATVALIAAGLGACIGHVATAADLPPAPPPARAHKAPVVVAAYSWAGFYVGFNAGGAWGRSHLTTATVFSAPGYFTADSVAVVNAAGDQSSTANGFTGGIQAGFNVQSGALVAGIEAELDYFGLRGSSSGSGVFPCCAPAGFTITSSVKTDWLATIRGRLGVASGNWLFYVTGGAAFTNLKGDFAYTDNCFFVPACFGTGGPSVIEAVSFSNTKTGYAVGGGVEAGLWGNWSFKAEYLYVDFGSVSAVGVISTPAAIAVGAANNPFTHSLDLKAHIARLGVNYRFGPVVAAY